MSSAHKKVILRRLTGETLPGYLPVSRILVNRAVDLLDLSGRVVSVPLAEIKHVCYVRDFNLSDSVNPERLTRRTFLARPPHGRSLGPDDLPLPRSKGRPLSRPPRRSRLS